MKDRELPGYGDLSPKEQGPRIIVVLVEPKDARNIGAVARAMSNLDVKELRLVAPERFDPEMARGVSCWGSDVVDNAARFDLLREAVADAHEVVGFASDSGRHRTPQRLLSEWTGSLVDDPHRTIALVFGSEEVGLRREHFPLCQFLVRIPSAAGNRSYNLAQAVLLALYALRSSKQDVIGPLHDDWPTSAQLENFTEMVLRVSEDVGFLNQHAPQHVRDLLINVTRRGRLSTRELKILTGLFGQIYKALP